MDQNRQQQNYTYPAAYQGGNAQSQAYQAWGYNGAQQGFGAAQWAGQQSPAQAPQSASGQTNEEELRQQWALYFQRHQQWQQYFAQMGMQPPPQGFGQPAQMTNNYASQAKPPLPANNNNDIKPAHTQLPQYAQYQQPQNTTEGKKQGDQNHWPDSLRRFVARSLEEATKAGLREQVDQELKAIIEDAVRTGDLWARNWNTALSPLQKVKRKAMQGGENTPVHKTGDGETIQQQGAGRKRRWEDLKVGEKNKLSLVDIQKDQEKEKEREGLTNSSNIDQHRNSWSSTKPKQGWKDFAKSSSSTIKVYEPPTPSKALRKGIRDLGVSNEEMEQRNRRLARFQGGFDSGKQLSPINRYDPYAAGNLAKFVQSAMQRAEQEGEEIDLDEFIVQGTSTNLEKPYLRLTGVPDPSSVRPQHILEESLKMVCNRWEKSPQNKFRSDESNVELPGVTYLWVCEQLKSIRQDLTVQHIKNDFTVAVYETHGRISLKEGDLKEFNQCMTQLQDMYHKYDGLGSDESKAEFAGYNILYLVYTQLKYGQPKSELANLLSTMPRPLFKSQSVRHALAIRSTLERGMYRAFFTLHKAAPKLGGSLTVLLLGFARFKVIQATCSAFRPSVPLDALLTIYLDFDKQGSLEANQSWQEILDNYPGITLTNNGTSIDTKNSMGAFAGNYQWPVLDGDSVQR